MWKTMNENLRNKINVTVFKKKLAEEKYTLAIT